MSFTTRSCSSIDINLTDTKKIDVSYRPTTNCHKVTFYQSDGSEVVINAFTLSKKRIAIDGITPRDPVQPSRDPIDETPINNFCPGCDAPAHDIVMHGAVWHADCHEQYVRDMEALPKV